MRALVYRNRLGPAVVFLPPATKGGIPRSAAVPTEDKKLVREAYVQVAAKGPKMSWDKHSEALVKSPPYAGTWTIEDVPDDYGPQQALAWIRSQDSSKQLEPDNGSKAE